LEPYTRARNAAVVGKVTLFDDTLTLEYVYNLEADPRFSITDDVVIDPHEPLETRQVKRESLTHALEGHALSPDRTEPLQ